MRTTPGQAARDLDATLLRGCFSSDPVNIRNAQERKRHKQARCNCRNAIRLVTLIRNTRGIHDPETELLAVPRQHLAFYFLAEEGIETVARQCVYVFTDLFFYKLLVSSVSFQSLFLKSTFASSKK